MRSTSLIAVLAATAAAGTLGVGAAYADTEIGPGTTVCVGASGLVAQARTVLATATTALTNIPVGSTVLRDVQQKVVADDAATLAALVAAQTTACTAPIVVVASSPPSSTPELDSTDTPACQGAKRGEREALKALVDSAAHLNTVATDAQTPGSPGGGAITTEERKAIQAASVIENNRQRDLRSAVTARRRACAHNTTSNGGSPTSSSPTLGRGGVSTYPARAPETGDGTLADQGTEPLAVDAALFALLIVGVAGAVTAARRDPSDR